MADSDTGVWIDTATGQVVTSEPTEGVQLAAPGVTIDDPTAALIAAARAAAPEAPVKRPAPKAKP